MACVFLAFLLAPAHRSVCVCYCGPVLFCVLTTRGFYTSVLICVHITITNTGKISV